MLGSTDLICNSLCGHKAVPAWKEMTFEEMQSSEVKCGVRWCFHTGWCYACRAGPHEKNEESPGLAKCFWELFQTTVWNGYRHVWASLRPFVRSLCQLDFSCLPALFPVLYPNCGNVALSMRWAKRLARQYILRGVRWSLSEGSCLRFKAVSVPSLASDSWYSSDSLGNLLCHCSLVAGRKYAVGSWLIQWESHWSGV